MKKLRLIFAVMLMPTVFFPLTADGQVRNKSQLEKTTKGASQIIVHGDKFVDMKDFYDPSSPTSGIQEAVDYLKPEGGTLFLSPGIYKVRKSVVLSSGIYIKGSGEHTIIERLDSCIQKPLISAGNKGDTEIELSDTQGFFKGGEITVFSNTFSGFNCTSANIREVREGSLLLDGPLSYNYLPENRAGVVNFFPVFTAFGGARNIRIENLVIDGRMKAGSNFHSDFICSAIHFVHVSDIIFDKVIVTHFPGDGFSVQGGSNASVTNCVAEYNLGNGYHPGTFLRVSTWANNIGRFNDGDGLYFCYNVRYANVSDNHFYNNKNNGIGDLGKGGVEGDQMNVVSGNFCYNNYRSGIACTEGGNNIIVNNICENNSKADPGKWAEISLTDTHSSVIMGNRCSNSRPLSGNNKSYRGIMLIGKCEDNIITDNVLSGFSIGISGTNQEMNIIDRNIIIEKHRPETPEK